MTHHWDTSDLHLALCLAGRTLLALHVATSSHAHSHPAAVGLESPSSASATTTAGAVGPELLVAVSVAAGLCKGATSLAPPAVEGENKGIVTIVTCIQSHTCIWVQLYIPDLDLYIPYAQVASYNMISKGVVNANAI